MGSSMSVPKTEVVVGKANRDVSNIYRTHRVQDHLCPYDPKQTVNAHFPNVELAMALDAFNTKVECKLNLQHRSTRVTKSDIDIYRSNINKVKTLQNALLTSADTKNFKIEIGGKEININLCKNYLVELNDIPWKDTSATSLQICCNYLRYLPYGICQLAGLKMLIAAKNRISEIPENIGLCRELKEIDMSSNLIKRLPKSFVCLKKLNTLHFGNNLLAEVPAFIGKMESLKYLNLSNNRIRSIPLEILKLPYLLSLNCVGCPLNTKNRKIFEAKGEMTLAETVARRIIRKNLPVRSTLEAPVINYLMSVQECSFCGGPFFDYCVSVEDFYVFESEIYPTHYKMCSFHYKKHEERLSTLFENTIPTYPKRLIDDNLRSVTELFVPEACPEDVAARGMTEVDMTGMIPLICLSRYVRKHRPNQIDLFFRSDQGNSNIFDHMFDQM